MFGGVTYHIGHWHVLRRESLLHDIMEGRMKWKAARSRKRMHLLNDLIKAKYVALKSTAGDRKEWTCECCMVVQAVDL